MAHKNRSELSVATTVCSGAVFATYHPCNLGLSGHSILHTASYYIVHLHIFLNPQMFILGLQIFT